MRTTTPTTQAIVVLDQSSGQLRTDDKEVLGLDLWPETAAAFSQAAETGLAVTVAVPSELPGVEDLDSWAHDYQVARIREQASFAAAGQGPTLDLGEPTTALVAADRRLRGEAARAGLQPAPHSCLLPMLARGEIPDPVRLVGPKDILMRLAHTHENLPAHFQPVSDHAWALITLALDDLVAAAVAHGLQVNQLPYDPMTDDLVWIRPGAGATGSDITEALGGRRVLHAEHGQILVALGPDDRGDSLHIDSGHGHTEFLMLTPGLLAKGVHASIETDTIQLARLPEPIIERVRVPKLDPKILALLRPSCATVTSQYEADLDRYTGVTALDSTGTIASRHIAHPDNKRVEAQLFDDLRAIGYCPWRHSFSHAGQTLSNIVADLPGRGIFQIRPEILKRYRTILARRPFPTPLEPYRREMEALFDEDWLDADEHSQISDRELRVRIEQIFRLRPWYPWWNRLCSMAGYGADLVIVGCHLDATAGFEPGYDAATDPAPGRDDNASGLAGVLSMARYLWRLRGHLRHTVRFCFFNAEEQGLVGSKAYAALLKSTGAPVKAAICMDMIGYNSDQHRLFEIHAGYTDPVIRDLSVPLATPIANAAANYGQLAPAQVYSGTSWGGAPDRSVFDGAINRSDHAAFHQQGYGAVLVSEDFFANLASEPGADSNPNYHRAADTTIDLAFAGDIVCAVNQAVLDLAR